MNMLECTTTHQTMMNMLGCTAISHTHTHTHTHTPDNDHGRVHTQDNPWGNHCNDELETRVWRRRHPRRAKMAFIKERELVSFNEECREGGTGAI